MFTKLALPLLSIAALAGNVVGAPINPKTQSLDRRFISFDHFDGLSSFSGFDSFYGVDNFSGVVTSQVVVTQEEEVVCQSVSIEIIQQRLLVLQEMARRIITEQICEVETQTVVFQQFISSSTLFSSDLLRTSGRHVGFDSNIVSFYGSLLESDGSLSTSDFGFSGSDAGQSLIVPSGNNWNDATSPSSVSNAFNTAVSASNSSSTAAPPVISSSNSTSTADAALSTSNSTNTTLSASNSTATATASNSTSTSA